MPAQETLTAASLLTITLEGHSCWGPNSTPSWIAGTLISIRLHKHLFCAVSWTDTHQTGFLHCKKRHNESGQGSWRTLGLPWHSPGWQSGSAYHREAPFLSEPQASQPSSRANSKCILNGLSTLWGRLGDELGGRVEQMSTHCMGQWRMNGVVWSGHGGQALRQWGKEGEEMKTALNSKAGCRGMSVCQASDVVFIL